MVAAPLGSPATTILGQHVCYHVGSWRLYLGRQVLIRTLTCDQLPDLQVGGLAE